MLLDTDRLIRVMPEALANKIAAGEVVQRPASALKELVENALDAGAEAVDVVLKGAGSTLVQVLDDGKGMSRADAPEAFRRHATSKLRDLADLERIQTLGFRGEALASIAAVAQVDLRTRRVADAAGTRIRAEGGAVAEAEPVATPPGTSIAVRNLFYNVPARRAFLKSPATEFRHLVETFQALALSHPDVAFTLVHDDAEVYRLRPLASDDAFDRLAHRVGELFDRELERALVRVEEATSYLTLRGFVGRPEHYRRSRGEQFLFVNDRVVRSRALDHAVTSAFEGLLPEGAYPFFALFLTIDPAHVDVNVHPSKQEVKFDDEHGLYRFVRAVVRKALGAADLVPTLRPDAPAATFLALAADAASAADLGAPAASFGTAPEGAAPFGPSFGPGAFGDAEGFGDAGPAPFAPAPFAWADPPPAAPVQQTLAADFEPHADDEDAPAETPLLQLHDAYVLTPIRSGLMILDQRAAHERVLYEKALGTLQSGLGLSQQLLFPYTVDLTAPDLALLKELAGELVALGFDLEFFSGRTVVVRGVPADIRAGDERNVLKDLLDGFRNVRESLRLRNREALARAVARRSAIRAGQRLTPPEMRALIDQLFACDVPYSAPDGRPTLVKLSTEELAKRFGR